MEIKILIEKYKVLHIGSKNIKVKSSNEEIKEINEEYDLKA